MSDLFLSPSRLSDPPKSVTASFGSLSGGLNLWQMDYRMDADQSPEMKNLWWRDGILSCRDGQEYVSSAVLGKGICCYERLFYGHLIAHIGDGLYAAAAGSVMEPVRLCDGIPEERGTFLRYRDALLYKTKGAYKKITMEEGVLTAQEVEAYVPVTVINCTPEGSGDLYQPENRLSSQKTVWYTAAVTTHGVVFEADGYAEKFLFTAADEEPILSVEEVYIGTTLQDAANYIVAEDNSSVEFYTAPSKGKSVTITYTVGQRVYKLPVTQVDSIDKVLVDEEEAAYTADPEEGTITFEKAPTVQDPPVNNTIKVTYSKANPDAYNAIMDCRYACAYGGTGGSVLVMAGSTAQPNAYFWNGSHVAMDMGYFPMSYYNLAGDDLEAVTGFGQQSGYLMVFKEHSVGKCLLASATIDERAHLTLDYTPVNTVMGCDLPWTIRLVENNLVWCSTYGGVCRMEDTTPALENQVCCISRNILGSTARPGLLNAVRTAKSVCALEDGDRYWVVADSQAYLWDHAISSASKPSWFYFTNIPAVSFCRGDNTTPAEEDGLSYTGARLIYHLDAQGRISRFVRTFRDYGGGIEKVYTFATQDFGSIERQKHVKKLILATRSDTDTVLRMEYLTDHGQRTELTPVRSYSWRLLPRDLSFRFLGVRRFAHIAVRIPGCRYVRFFSLRLYNAEPGCDMSVASAQMFADLVIKER